MAASFKINYQVRHVMLYLWFCLSRNICHLQPQSREVPVTAVKHVCNATLNDLENWP